MLTDLLVVELVVRDKGPRTCTRRPLVSDCSDSKSVLIEDPDVVFFDGAGRDSTILNIGAGVVVHSFLISIVVSHDGTILS